MWIQTYSGLYFDLAEPKSDTIRLEDVAHALAHLCRYTGHCSEFYSVAQHCVIVSRYVPRELALAGLLHDAAEAYIGDVARPLKDLMKSMGGDYKAIEHRVEAVVEEAFGLPEGILDAPEVKNIDTRALLSEKRDLMSDEPHSWRVWTEGYEPLPTRIYPVLPKTAKQMFLRRYEELTGDPTMRLEERESEADSQQGEGSAGTGYRLGEQRAGSDREGHAQRVREPSDGSLPGAGCG